MKDKILSAYEQMAVRYNELIEHKPHNAYYDRPNTLRLMPEVRGKQSLTRRADRGNMPVFIVY